jgi:DNA-binding transcriptional LysR family regulator
MLDRLECEAFLVLAEELHFGRTAQRLHVSTARISQTIKQLERRVGTSLFERSSRRVVLTAVGRQLYEDLRPAYGDMQAGLARAVGAGRGITGALRVGYSAPWCGDLVVRAADHFRVRHPECTVDVQEIQLSDPLGPLRAGEVDIQLTELPVDEPDIANGPIVYQEPRALLVPVDHAFAERESVGLEDLADTPVITVTGAIPPYWNAFHYPNETPSGRPIDKGPALTYWQEVLPQVAAGKGVSPTCARASRYHQHPGVTYVRFHDAPTVDYGLLWRTTDENARLRNYTAILLELTTRT